MAELVAAFGQQFLDLFELEVRGQTEYCDGPEPDKLATLFVAPHVIEVQRERYRADRRQHSRRETVGTYLLRSFDRRFFCCVCHTDIFVCTDKAFPIPCRQS